MAKGVCVTGNFKPLSSGIKQQDSILSQCLEQELGVPVLCLSRSQNRFARPLCIFFGLLSSLSKFDVLIVQAFSYLNFINAALAIIIGRISHKKIIVVYRGGWAGKFLQTYGFIVKSVLSLADEIVTPSRFLQEIFGSHSIQVKQINNILETSRWEVVPRQSFSPDIAWARTLCPVYNPKMAIRVIHQLKTAGLEARLFMAGRDEGLGDECRKEAESLGVAEQVQMLGRKPQEELRTMYEKCSFFINTSLADNQPLSVLEAMKTGLIVVSVDVGGVPEIIEDGKNGFLVQTGDDHAMAEKILSVLKNPSIAAEISRAAVKTADGFSWTAVRGAWLELLVDRKLRVPR